MERRIVGRGLLAGTLAGVLAFLYARVFVEPIISRAIDYEAGRGDADAAIGGSPGRELELYSRDVQSWVGMGVGVLAFSVALAGVFAVVFSVVYARVAGLSVRTGSAVLAAAAFVTVYLVPFLKYPANPPSIGSADTIKERAGLYLLMVLLSVGLAVGALWLGRRLAPRVGTWWAVLTALGGYMMIIGAAMWVLPVIADTPQPLTDKSGRIVYPGFPADDLYHFRLYAVGAQAVIWATIGLVFGALVSRLLEDQRPQRISP